ncbi:hypothetical protein J3458_014349 [Metarhizium acridum]|uniref:uncharacterized protein n=1 Tax=Metarhizium acridum TaxID=92637 RepID=UPI001C6AFA99|nr:hypothetical protein J3458_014349 [Metarhizium acridum]
MILACRHVKDILADTDFIGSDFLLLGVTPSVFVNQGHTIPTFPVCCENNDTNNRPNILTFFFLLTGIMRMDKLFHLSCIPFIERRVPVTVQLGTPMELFRRTTL